MVSDQLTNLLGCCTRGNARNRDWYDSRQTKYSKTKGVTHRLVWTIRKGMCQYAFASTVPSHVGMAKEEGEKDFSIFLSRGGHHGPFMGFSPVRPRVGTPMTHDRLHASPTHTFLSSVGAVLQTIPLTLFARMYRPLSGMGRSSRHVVPPRSHPFASVPQSNHAGSWGQGTL